MDRIATMGVFEGLYWGEIRDEYGDVESMTICQTPADVHRWACDHGCVDIILKEVRA